MDVTIAHPEDAVPTVVFPTHENTASGKAMRNVGVSFSQHARPPAPRPAAPPAPAPPPPNPRVDPNVFADFANPQKSRPAPPPQQPPSSSGGSEDYGDGSEDGDAPPSSSAPGDDDEEEEASLVSAGGRRSRRPREGYRTIDEEKADLSGKLHRLKRQGMTHVRVPSNLDDLRVEYDRVRLELDMDASLKFQRKMLVALTSGMEFLNKRYDPFDLQLDGWSEQVCESVTDYDRIFERLFLKYRSKISCPPEMELLLMLGSSAFMFHLTNTMVKKGLASNPDFMEKMATAMAQAQAQQASSAKKEEEEEQPQSEEGQPREFRREVRPPAFDPSALFGSLGGLGGIGMPPIGLAGPGIPRPRVTVAEEEQPARKKARVVSEVSESEEEEERLSDAVTTDDDSLETETETSSEEGGSDDQGGIAVPMITSLVPAPPPSGGRGRGGPRGRGGRGRGRTLTI